MVDPGGVVPGPWVNDVVSASDTPSPAASGPCERRVPWEEEEEEGRACSRVESPAADHDLVMLDSTRGDAEKLSEGGAEKTTGGEDKDAEEGFEAATEEEIAEDEQDPFIPAASPTASQSTAPRGDGGTRPSSDQTAAELQEVRALLRDVLGACGLRGAEDSDEEAEGDGEADPPRVVTPFLPVAACAWFVLWWVCAGTTAVSLETFQPDLHCPVVEVLREVVSADSVLYYKLKPTLASTCDTEDSFYLFFRDAWIRGVVTDSDSWYLILLQLEAAVIGTAVLLVAAPALASVYAAAYCVAAAVEGCLPRWRWLRGVASVAEGAAHAMIAPYNAAALLCRSSPLALFFRGVKGGSLDDGVALYRRVASDFDAALGFFTRPRGRGAADRRSRAAPVTYASVYTPALRGVETFVLTAVSVVFALRFACLWLDADIAIRAAVQRAPYLRDIYADHAAAYGHEAAHGRGGVTYVVSRVSDFLAASRGAQFFAAGLVGCVAMDVASLSSVMAAGDNRARTLRRLMMRADRVLGTAEEELATPRTAERAE